MYDPCFRSTTVVQGFPAVYSFFLALRNATLTFISFLTFSLFCPFFVLGAFCPISWMVVPVYRGYPKMLPVTASRHPDSEMMVVPGFPASHHHRLSLFLSLSLCINNIEKYPSRLCCVRPSAARLFFGLMIKKESNLL